MPPIKFNRKLINNFSHGFLLGFFLIFSPFQAARALPIGTLLYRTSDGGQMYGYNSKDLIVAEKGIIKHIYSGHVGIYVGQENGVDYVVEALGDGVVKNPAKYFVNSAQGEQFIGAKFPRKATPTQAATAALIAKKLAADNLAYDLDFKTQKGPNNGDWTCVGVTEKVYESANIPNPDNLGALEYNPDYYGVDITPDGYDNYSFYNSRGDCFSKQREFSKINRQTDMLVPLPELIGYAAGLEYNNERYIFLPYTQFVQPSLKEVPLDIEISSSFPDEGIRGQVSVWPLVLKWSLINNPISSLKRIVRAIFPLSSSEEKILAEATSPEPPSLEVDNKTVTSTISPSDKSSDNISDPVNQTPDLLEIIPTPKKTSSTSSSAKVSNANTKTSSTTSKIPSANTTKAISSVSIPKTSAKTSSPTTSVKTSSSTATSLKKAVSSLTKPSVTTATAKTTQPKAPVVQAAVQTKVIKSTVTATSAVVAYVKPASNYVIATTSDPNASDNTSNASSMASNAATTTASSTGALDLASIDPALILAPGHLVISRVGEAGDDDWVELFNPYPVAFDLALNNYRLERSKTAADPSIMLRFGELADGIFKTTVIPPYGRYLITRSDASAELQNQAQAISGRNEFSWLQSGYTLYLGDDAISSNSDPNIKDYLGFGEATYYEGGGPAPALIDNYYLSRKALATSTPVLMLEGGEHNFLDLVYDSDNNQFDWLLLPASGHLENSATTSATSTNNLTDYGLESVGLNYVDHFDECYQDGESFAVGKWGCARILYFNYPQEKFGLNPILTGGNFSINLFYKSLGAFPRFYWRLTNENSNEDLEISLETYSQISGLPNIAWRNYDHNWYPDNNWHELTLVANQAAGYWALYNDGEEVYKKNIDTALPTFKFFQFGGSNDYVALDELGIWNRALSPAEIKIIKDANLPFKPVTPLAPLAPAVLTNFYGFDENSGSIIHDSINSNNLNIAYNPWYSNGKVGAYIFQDQQQLLISGALNEISGSDLSVTFWWRNRAHPNEGRLRLALNHDTKTMFGVVAGNYRPAYIFNNVYGVVEEGINRIIPYDDAWHHLALTYSARDYLLNFYVDGLLRMSRPYIWIQPGEPINKIELIDENYSYDIDELGIWRGTLSALEVKNIYEAQ